MTCAVSFERVVDWWLDDLSSTEHDAFELHLFACDACAERVRAVARIASALGAILEERKSHPLVIDSTELQLWQRTKQVGVQHARAGDSLLGKLAPGDELLALRIAADFRGVSRVTLQLLAPDDSVLVEVPDAPFTEQEIIIACTRQVAMVSPELRLRILGDDRELARLYLVNPNARPPTGG